MEKNTSQPWDIDIEDFYHQPTETDTLKFLLKFAILAPSTHNSQPWKFKIIENRIEVYIDRGVYTIVEADPIGRDLYMSIGAMLQNLLIVSRFYGLLESCIITPSATNGPVAIFTYTQDPVEPDKSLRPLTAAIPRRLNARGIFLPRPLPSDLIDDLANSPLEHSASASLKIITDSEKVHRIARLTQQGLRLAYKNPSFRKEMSRWIHSSSTSKKDGLPGYSLKMPWLLSFVLPTIIRFFDIGAFLGKKNYDSIITAPAIGVFTAPQGNLATWIAIGRWFEHVSLQLVAHNFYTSVFVASIEMGNLAVSLQNIIQSADTPQFLFCIGAMQSVPPHSPRHSVEEKLMT